MDTSHRPATTVAPDQSSDPALNNLPVTVYRPTRGWIRLNLRELWQYRELFYFLVWRDVKGRYKQTIIGASWAIIKPLFTMVVFSIFFGELAGVPSDGVPYPIFSYVALVPWMYFSGALTQASESVVLHADMVKKVYFPRLIMPAAAVLANAVDFALMFIILILMMLFYRVPPTLGILWLLPLFLLATLAALGAGLWLSAMNVLFRDVRQAVPFLVQAWLFITPIAYPSSLIDEQWRILYALNPMAGVVEGFRWALLGAGARAPLSMIAVSTVAALVLFLTGLFYFRRMERIFADVA